MLGAELSDWTTGAMKSQNNSHVEPDQDVLLMSAEFWSWFVSVQDRMAGLLGKSADSIDPQVITQRVNAIQPKLGWEIGPGGNKPFRFVISPSGIRSLISIADIVVKAAPELKTWEICSCKPPKQWDYEVRLRNNLGQYLSLDASNWKYALTGFAERDAFDVIFVAPELPNMDASSRKGAAYIVLDSIFGERVAIETFMKVDLILACDAAKAIRDRLTKIQSIENHISSLVGRCRENESDGNAKK
jgi:hypothetical protein